MTPWAKLAIDLIGAVVTLGFAFAMGNYWLDWAKTHKPERYTFLRIVKWWVVGLGALTMAGVILGDIIAVLH